MTSASPGRRPTPASAPCLPPVGGVVFHTNIALGSICQRILIAITGRLATNAVAQSCLQSQVCSRLTRRRASWLSVPACINSLTTCSADGSVRLWRLRCWTCIRIFACAQADPAAPPCPFLSTAMTEKCASFAAFLAMDSDSESFLWQHFMMLRLESGSCCRPVFSCTAPEGALHGGLGQLQLLMPSLPY